MPSKAYDRFSDALGSSPPPELDPTERLEKYFMWLVSQSQLQAELFEKAEIVVKKAGHTFMMMFTISDKKWAEWEVPDGIVLQIHMGKAKFKSIEALG